MSQLGRVPALGRGIFTLVQRNLQGQRLLRPLPPLLLVSRNQVRLTSGYNKLASKSPQTPNFDAAIRRRDSVKAWKIFSEFYEHGQVKILPSKQITLLLRLIEKGRDPNTVERCRRIITYIERNDVELISITEYSTLVLYHAKSGNVKCVEEILQRMLQKGLKLTPDLYIELIVNLKRSSPLPTYQLYQMLLQQDIIPNTYAYNAVMKMLSKHQQFNQVSSVYFDMKKFQISPNDETYSLMLNSCARSSNSSQAQEIYKEMMEQDIVPDVTSFSVFINLLINQGKLEQARDAYNDMIHFGHSPNIWTYSILIKGYGRKSRLDEAVALFEEMLERGITPNVVTYSTLIQGFALNQDLSRAMSYYKRMLAEDILPNEITYSILISAFAKNSDVQHSLELYQHMLSRKLVPDTAILNSLIYAFSNSQEMQEASKTFEEILSRNLTPDVVTFTTLIDGYAKVGDLDQAQNLFESMKPYQVAPNVKTYTTLINGFGKQSNMDKAISLFEEMKTVGLRPNTLTYNCLIDGYMKSSSFDRAVGMFEQMKESKIPLITSTYNIIMHGCLVNFKLEQVLPFYHELIDQRLVPDAITYGVLMNFHSFVGDKAKILELWNIARKTFPTKQLSAHVSILLDSCGVNGDLEALKITWSNLKDARFPLSENNFNSYIEALCKFESFNEAKRVFTTELKECGIKPSSKSLQTLLNQIKHRPQDTREIIDLVQSEYPSILSPIPSREPFQVS
ncbi:hypothetical protein K7432_011039 [Basidiobolus ranarum]|uniref:PROP1-like PPR domain-containing protein n=1 Tax=Basidiobolus ranarum TaxID=34480 RepID=A0ABR2VUX9_9FUNG